MSKSTTDNTGLDEGALAVNARDVQRAESTRHGKYLCAKCNTTFDYQGTDKLVCPKCKNDKQDTLTAIYTEEDPRKDELLGKDEFSAGD
jgi:protein-arginine kinase activator protein McsA